MKNNYCVYKHTVPNGKVYIGITGIKPERRWQNGYGYKRQKYFYHAIEKYGWDNFRHEILFNGLTKEEAEQKEIELIALYKSNKREYGYNVANGGLVNSGYNLSEKTKRKISNAHKGKKLSEEQKVKMRVPHKLNDAKSKPILCVETNTVYKSSMDAQRITGIDNSKINAVCNHKQHRKTAGGFHWEFV